MTGQYAFIRPPTSRESGYVVLWSGDTPEAAADAWLTPECHGRTLYVIRSGRVTHASVEEAMAVYDVLAERGELVDVPESVEVEREKRRRAT